MGDTAFSLVTGALVIAAGKFGDVFGRCRILTATLALIPPQFSGSAKLTASACGRRWPGVGRRWARAIGDVLTDGLGRRSRFSTKLPLAAGYDPLQAGLTHDQIDQARRALVTRRRSRTP